MPQPQQPRTLFVILGVAGVLAVALALRLAYVFQVAGTSLVQPTDLDPGFYYDWARAIAAGDWLGREPFVQSPLYAYLLGLFIALFGAAVTPILVAQSLVGVGTVALTYLAGRRFFDARHGLLSAGLLAVYGPFLFYEGMVMKTFLSPFLTVLLALALERAARAPEAPRRFALAGVLFGLLTLDRDNFILLAPILAWLAFRLAPGRRAGLRAALAFSLGAIVIIAPVTLRNWAVSKELVLLTTGGGEVFFIGNNADANGLYVPPPFVRPDPKYEHADFVERASEISGRPLSPMQSSWFWFKEGLAFIGDQPLAWLRLEGRKLFFFWNWYELPDNLDYNVVQWFSPLLRALNVTIPAPPAPAPALPAGGGLWLQARLHLYSTYGLLAPLGLLGLALTRGRWRDLLPLHVLLFGYMGTVLLFFNFSRFRVPVVPILALFAAPALLALGGALRRVGALLVALAGRSGDLPARTRALVPRGAAAGAAAVFVVSLVGVNLEYPRGVVPAIEQALLIGNAYYGQGDAEKAQESYSTGLFLLGEGPAGAAGDALLRRQFGPAVTREAIGREIEVESVARGPQFKGIHLGIHHGLGIAFVQQAQSLLDAGRRAEAMLLLDRAIAQFDEALRIAPSYLLSHRKMARAWILKGDTARGAEWLRKAVDLWPEDVQARLELAEVLYSSGEFKDALRQLDAARHYNATMPPEALAQLSMNRGLIFMHGLGDPGRALYDLEQALVILPNHPQATAIRQAIQELRLRGALPVPDEGMAPPAEKPPATSSSAPAAPDR